MISLQDKLITAGLSFEKAFALTTQIEPLLKDKKGFECWKSILHEMAMEDYPFAIYQTVYELVYANGEMPFAVWTPDKTRIETANITRWMKAYGFQTVQAFHSWSVNESPQFWQSVVKSLGIHFDKPYEEILDASKSIASPKWFLHSKLNIANSCFKAPKEAIAIIESTPTGECQKISYETLDKLSNRVANSIQMHFQKGDRIAVIMPMTANAIAICLGIIKAGCCVVSIADHFSAKEMAVRLQIAKVKAVFTQIHFLTEGKKTELYEKLIDANAPFCIVLPNGHVETKVLRNQDTHWATFLHENTDFTPLTCDPLDEIQIFFASSSAGKPKTIAWDHITPIKCASDAYFYQNIQPQDIICWPSNLGYMMGIWLIYAALINRATIAIYHDLPNDRGFGKFIADSKVTCLGVIPTFINTWRKTACMEGLDWSTIKLYSSTAPCFSDEDILYLMWLGKFNKPMIEYYGSTKIGGAYLTGTVIEPCALRAFTTPALGIDLKIVHKNGDHIEKYQNGFYRVQRHSEESIHLNSIKTGSVEVEIVPKVHPHIQEIATKEICLALQGGGAYGAYTWGILDRLLEDDRMQIKAISSTSAGSVNSIVLAHGLCQNGNHGAREALNDFWSTLSHYASFFSPIKQPMTSEQLDNDLFSKLSFLYFDWITRTFSPYSLNPFNFDIVRMILNKKVNFDELRINRVIKLFLCATNVKTGKLKIFENAHLSTEAVLASSCLPNLSQAVEVDGEYYWDGGYLGNPAIFPLFYHSKVDDILIVHNNPIIRDQIPITSADIVNRLNEVSFNSSLLRELRAIAYVTKLIDKGWIKEEYRAQLRKKYIHIIRSEEAMSQFSLMNKYNLSWRFINHLKHLGRATAEKWLVDHFDHLGKKSTIDYQEFLEDDTQSTQ